MEFLSFLEKDANKQLEESLAIMTKINSEMGKIGEKRKSISTPSGSDASNAQLVVNYQKLEKAVEKQRLAEIKLQQAREKSFDNFTKQNQKETNAIIKQSGLYNRAQITVSKLSEAYNNLAIKKEFGHKLTLKEEADLHRLTNEINIYQSALKKVDANIQKNTRNVGNYASGWNGLGNSINQLTREMPAFANSAQTGFMALSNNLPILFDEINRVKQANKDLISQGQPIKSTFLQIAGAILSWQTLLSVGVTLLTVYGAKIWDSVSGSKEKKKALEAEKKALDEKIQAEQRSNEEIGQSIAQEQNRARILFEIAKNEDVRDSKRNSALKELRERYGKYLKDLTDQEILAGKTAEAEERLNEALVKRGYALATQSLLEKNATAQMSAQVEMQKVMYKNLKDLNSAQTNSKTTTEQYFAVTRKASKAEQEALKVLEAKLKPLKEEEELLLSLFRINAPYLDAINDTTKKTKEATKAKRDDVESVIAQGLKSQEYLQVLEEQLRLYKEVQSEVSSTSDEYKAFQNVIDGLQQSIDLIKDPSKVLTANVSGLERQNEMYLKNKEALEKLQEVTDKWLETFRTDFFQQMGLGSLDQFFDGTFDKLIAGADSVEEKFRVSFLAISEVAQEAFNLINQAGQASTQAEIDRLKIQYDTAWEFSDKSDVAKRKLDAERERREKEIAQKEFKRKQNMAVVNIGIDTAQAIMATYGQAGWIGGTAGAIFLGAMGLAQIALVKSQKMPEYKDGTPFGGHGGGLMKINDAKGSNYQEIVKTPDGKMGMFKGRNVVVDAPKGTEVFTADESIRMMMFDPYLNNMISSTSTPVFKTEIQTQNIDFSPVVDAINNQPIIIPDFDKLKTRIKRGNTIQTIEKAHTNFSSVKI
jgi:hypothetical protein